VPGILQALNTAHLLLLWGFLGGRERDREREREQARAWGRGRGRDRISSDVGLAPMTLRSGLAEIKSEPPRRPHC